MRFLWDRREEHAAWETLQGWIRQDLLFTVQVPRSQSSSPDPPRSVKTPQAGVGSSRPRRRTAVPSFTASSTDPDRAGSTSSPPSPANPSLPERSTPAGHRKRLVVEAIPNRKSKYIKLVYTPIPSPSGSRDFTPAPERDPSPASPTKQKGEEEEVNPPRLRRKRRGTDFRDGAVIGSKKKSKIKANRSFEDHWQEYDESLAGPGDFQQHFRRLVHPPGAGQGTSLQPVQAHELLRVVSGFGSSDCFGRLQRIVKEVRITSHPSHPVPSLSQLDPPRSRSGDASHSTALAMVLRSDPMPRTGSLDDRLARGISGLQQRLQDLEWVEVQQSFQPYLRRFGLMHVCRDIEELTAMIQDQMEGQDRGSNPAKTKLKEAVNDRLLSLLFLTLAGPDHQERKRRLSKISGQVRAGKRWARLAERVGDDLTLLLFDPNVLTSVHEKLGDGWWEKFYGAVATLVPWAPEMVRTLRGSWDALQATGAPPA